jgi:hypothetical protein
MFRKALLAVAATLMTATAFGSTLGIMNAGSSAPVSQVA